MLSAAVKLIVALSQVDIGLLMVRDFGLLLHSSLTSSSDHALFGFVSGNLLEEVFFDIVELSLHLSLLSSGDLGWVLNLLFLLCLALFLGVSLSESLGNDEILLSSGLTIESGNHDFLLFVGDLIKRLAKLHDGDGTLSISDSTHSLVHRNGSKWRITDLLTVGALVLAVVEVPHIEETVDSSQVEKTGP